MWTLVQDASVPLKAFMRRAIRRANALDRAVVPQPSAGSAAPSGGPLYLPTHPQNLLQARVVEVVGPDHSAATLAKILSANSNEVDIARELTTNHLDKLPFHMTCDKTVFTIMGTENKAAQTASRTAFSYIDITSKEVLPMWLPHESIGGRSAFGSEWNSDASSASLAQLGRALQAATTQRKLFRTFSQWVGTMMKYGAAAVGMQQMSPQ